jgi:hypothetical protein
MGIDLNPFDDRGGPFEVDMRGQGKEIGAAIGSIWGPTGAAVGGAIGGGLDSAYAKSEQSKANKHNPLAKLRRQAEEAGFNPLTVLRATGGQGFQNGSSAILASGSFWANFGNISQQIATQFDPHKQMMRRYDADIAKETVWNMKNEDDRQEVYLGIAQDRLSLDKEQLVNSDPYKGYGKTIPVRYGDGVYDLEITVAKRLGFKPNDLISPGDLPEIFGELTGESIGALATKGQNAVMGGDGSAWQLLGTN